MVKQHRLFQKSGDLDSSPAHYLLILVLPIIYYVWNAGYLSLL